MTYVMVDSEKRSFVSQDGLSWTGVDPGPANFQAGATFRGGTFMLAVDPPASIYRWAGAAWLPVHDGTPTARGSDMASSPNRIVAIYGDGTSAISPDGRSWERTPGAGYPGLIRWVHDRFFLMPSGRRELYVSADGSAWALAAITLAASSVRWPVAWDGSRFVASSSMGTMSSQDGVAWTRNPDGGLPLGPTVLMSARGASLVAGSRPSSPGNTTLYESHDGGASWRTTGIVTTGNLASPNGFTNSFIMAMPGGWFVWNESNPVAPYDNQTFWSPDGVGWVKLSTPVVREMGVAHPGGRFAFVEDGATRKLYRFDGAGFEQCSGSTPWTVDGLLALAGFAAPTIRAGRGAGAAVFYSGGHNAL